MASSMHHACHQDAAAASNMPWPATRPLQARLCGCCHEGQQPRPASALSQLHCTPRPRTWVRPSNAQKARTALLVVMSPRTPSMSRKEHSSLQGRDQAGGGIRSALQTGLEHVSPAITWHQCPRGSTARCSAMAASYSVCGCAGCTAQRSAGAPGATSCQPSHGISWAFT